jgi:hypothetical protein
VTWVADTRACEQCGTEFAPRREHARFCSAGCRVAWNHENTRDSAAETGALAWSIGALGEITERLARVGAWDPARVFGAVSESVWWVTIVDATMVRYYPDVYDEVLADRPAEQRKLIEETLTGLRFVRNQVGCGQVDFVREPDGQAGQAGQDGAGPAAAGITGWTWISLPKPALTDALPRGRAWEMRRYRAYQARLVGHTLGETFGRAACFLGEAAAEAVPAAEVSTQPAR